jgi:hypothetical protein
MEALGKAQTFAWGILLVGVTVWFAEGHATEPTRTLKTTTRSTSAPRVVVFKGTSQDGAGQLMPTAQTTDQAPKSATPPAQLSAAEASEALASAGISITPAMLGSKKPFTLTPASPRLANQAHIDFMNAYQGAVGGGANNEGGFYHFLGPQTGGTRYVDLYVPPSALIVGKSYLVDFAVYCGEPATWRVYMPKGGQEIQLQPGSQHVPVLVAWQGTKSSLSFHLTLSNFNAPWTFYSATVTELP